MRSSFLVIPWVVLVQACGDGGKGEDSVSTTTGETTSTAFDTEEELRDRSIRKNDGTCDVGFYFPATTTHMPMAVARFKAPDPPYEIRALSVVSFTFGETMWGGNDRDSSVPLELFAFVDSAENMDAYAAADATSLPEMPALVTATVTGTGDIDNGETEYITHVLDTPVRVEEEGYLWVGYRTLEEDNGGHCPAGCMEETQPGFQYMLEGNHFGNTTSEWAAIAAIPDVRVTVGYRAPAE